MGAVYEATHVDLGRLVAIKVLNEKNRASAERRERFHREAMIAGRLEHPHIVDVLDVSPGSDEEPPYLVMEKLQGRTLTALMREEGALDAHRAARLALQLLSALAAAHAEGVVHRDLKPANLMITSGYDGGEHLKVLDFGIARLMPETGAEKLTHTGQVLGTLNYMAPEQAVGSPVDTRADIYAAGAVLYSMLAGVPPIPGKNAAEVMARVIAGEWEPLSTVRPDVPKLAGVVQRAMAMNPERRFASAREMSAAIEAAVPDDADAFLSSPGAAPPATRAPSAESLPPDTPVNEAGSARVERSGPRPIVLLLAALAAAVLAALLVLFVRGEDHPRPSVDAPAPPPPAPAVPVAVEAAPMQPAARPEADDDADVGPPRADEDSTETEARAHMQTERSGAGARGPSCPAYIGSHGSLEARHNYSTQLHFGLERARHIAVTECLNDAHPGSMLVSIRIDAQSRPTRVRLSNANFLSSTERACIRRALSASDWSSFVGPDDLAFNMNVECL